MIGSNSHSHHLKGVFMKKYLTLVFCCAAINTTVLPNAAVDAQKTLKAVMIKMIIENDTTFPEALLKKAQEAQQQNKTEPKTTFKQLFTALKKHKKDPAILAILTQREDLKNAACTIENVLGDNETERQNLEANMNKYPDDMVDTFVNMKVMTKKFTPTDLASFESMLDAQEEAAPQA